MHHAFLHLLQLQPCARQHAAAWDRRRAKQAGGAPVTNDCLQDTVEKCIVLQTQKAEQQNPAWEEEEASLIYLET